MKNINESLAKIIKESLPEAVGSELKKRLTEADEMQVELTKNAAQLKRNQIIIAELQSLKTNKEELNRITVDLEAKRKIVEKENKELIIKDLQYQLNAEKRVSQAYDIILRGLVRNTEYKSSAFGHSSVMGQHGTISLPTSNTETKIAE